MLLWPTLEMGLEGLGHSMGHCDRVGNEKLDQCMNCGQVAPRCPHVQAHTAVSYGTGPEQPLPLCAQEPARVGETQKLVSIARRYSRRHSLKSARDPSTTKQGKRNYKQTPLYIQPEQTPDEIDPSTGDVVLTRSADRQAR